LARSRGLVGMASTSAASVLGGISAVGFPGGQVEPVVEVLKQKSPTVLHLARRFG